MRGVLAGDEEPVAGNILCCLTEDFFAESVTVERANIKMIDTLPDRVLNEVDRLVEARIRLADGEPHRPKSQVGNQKTGFSQRAVFHFAPNCLARAEPRDVLTQAVFMCSACVAGGSRACRRTFIVCGLPRNDPT